MPSLKALRGRVVIKFPKATKQTAGGILIPETSQLRPEIGEILDVGESLNDEEERTRRDLLELQRAGRRIPVSFAAGTSYWREYDGQAMNEAEWGWLKDVRVFRISELASFLEE